jgi:hypothetical protein
MRPELFPLALYRGDTYGWTFRVWQDTPGGIPADLTGVVAAAQVRDRPGGSRVMALDCQVAAPNLVNVNLPAGAWEGVQLGPRAAWDLELTYPSGTVVTIVAGPVAVTQDVTVPVVVAP